MLSKPLLNLRAKCFHVLLTLGIFSAYFIFKSFNSVISKIPKCFFRRYRTKPPLGFRRPFVHVRFCVSITITYSILKTFNSVIRIALKSIIINSTLRIISEPFFNFTSPCRYTVFRIKVRSIYFTFKSFYNIACISTKCC